MTFLEQLVISLLPVTWAMIALMIKWYFDNKKNKLDIKKWQAGHVVNRKLDALEKLNAQLSYYRLELEDLILFPPISVGELLDWVKSKRRLFRETWHKASIYLSNEDNTIMKDLDMQSKKVFLSILDNIPSDGNESMDKDRKLSLEDIEFNNLNDAFKNAIGRLRSKLNPEHLDRFLWAQ